MASDSLQSRALYEASARDAARRAAAKSKKMTFDHGEKEKKREEVFGAICIEGTTSTVG